jgi:hypothetical protein
MAAKTNPVPATDADARPPKSDSVLPFTLKTIAASLGGAVLTMVITGAQVWYNDHLDSMHRRGDQGVELQRSMFDKSGLVQRELLAIIEILKDVESHDAFQRARTKFYRDFRPAFDLWRANVLLLRNRAADLYGRPVAESVYTTREQGYHVDTCSVVVGPGQAETPGAACAAALDRELQRLRSLINRTTASPDLRVFLDDDSVVHSVDRNIFLAHFLLQRYLACKEFQPERRREQQQQGCEAPLKLFESLTYRAEILRFARINLADAVMRATN